LATATAQTLVPFVDLRRQHAPLADELRAAFERVVGASSFILGEEVEAFEREFAEFCSVTQCVGVNSGTAALSIMLQAAGIATGDQVIVPAHTFIATALAVLHAGAEPVCADVDSGTGLIDPGAVAAAIGGRTAAILAVHLYGQSAPMEELQVLADRHGLALFEDAAQAHGATYRGRVVGGLGRAGAFSFYPSKNLGALGDGGAICTNDGDLAERARRLRGLGRWERADHAVTGYNERLDGIQAAFLRVKLTRLPGWNDTRRAVASRYRTLLEDVELLEERPESPCVHHLFPIKVANRDLLAVRLRQRRVTTGIHYPLALPDQPALSIATDDAYAARDWAARELSLPIFPGISDDEVERVKESLTSLIAVVRSRV
jgi:dTDP-4-amino-4,6-dideoxygalactose transaminase